MKNILDKNSLITKAILDMQNGMCAVCGEGISLDTATIDHNHETGEIRGVLCRKCNTHVGIVENPKRHLKERYNPELAQKYLAQRRSIVIEARLTIHELIEIGE